MDALGRREHKLFDFQSSDQYRGLLGVEMHEYKAGYKRKQVGLIAPSCFPTNALTSVSGDRTKRPDLRLIPLYACLSPYLCVSFFPLFFTNLCGPPRIAEHKCQFNSQIIFLTMQLDIILFSVLLSFPKHCHSHPSAYMMTKKIKIYSHLNQSSFRSL